MLFFAATLATLKAVKAISTMGTCKKYQGATLSRLFSSGVLKQLATRGTSPLAADLVQESGFGQDLCPSTPLRKFFDNAFSFLSLTYRTEYVYKNAIATKILLGTHSLTTSYMLTEFRAVDCKADCVVLNGTSNVYEIKSDYDSLTRLARQLSAYKQVFDCVHVITSERLLPKVKAATDESVGLLVLGTRGNISTRRVPVSMKHQTSPAAIFDSLRRTEYEAIVRQKFGTFPDVPNTRIYRVCKDMFCQLPPAIAHDEMVATVKKRGSCLQLRKFIEGVPASLKAASISTRLTRSEQASLLTVMDQPIGECLV